jgi:hypothetical protein
MIKKLERVGVTKTRIWRDFEINFYKYLKNLRRLKNWEWT